MKPYIAFLRGVMPVGKNKVPMAELRLLLTKAGFSDVSTYIQSGNVLLRSDLSTPQIEERIHKLIEKSLGGDIAVVARTPAQLRKVMSLNPFPKADTTRVFFTLLQNKPDKKRIGELSGMKYPPDEFIIGNQIIYLHCPMGYGRTKLSNNFFEKKLGVAATTRNYRTMTKLAG